MNPLRVALRDYLRIRRSLGFKLESDERVLEDFIGFLEQVGATRIITEQALCWAKLPQNARAVPLAQAPRGRAPVRPVPSDDRP